MKKNNLKVVKIDKNKSLFNYEKKVLIKELVLGLKLGYFDFEKEKPQLDFLAAAKVGGILANKRYPADFLFDNLAISSNVIRFSHKHSVEKLLFLGSSCIYPKFAPQPISESSLLTGELEPTNEPYALAKIAR